MKLLSALVVIAISTLGGCGGEADPSADTPPSPPTRSTSSPTDASTPQQPTGTASDPSSPAPRQEPDPAARRVLRAAVLQLLRADTGTVHSLVALGPVRTYADSEYRLSDRSMSMHMTVSAPTEPPLAVDTIAIGQDGWFRITRDGSEPKQTCWMHSTPDGLESMTGVDLPSGSSGIPVGLLVAGNATALSQPDPAHVNATIDLYTAAGAFSGKLPITLGLDFRTKATAPVTFSMRDGAVTGWRITLSDLLHSVEDAGVELPPELQGFEQVALEDAGVSVNFSEPGREVTVEAPDADQVVELTTDQEQFAQDRKACDAEVN